MTKPTPAPSHIGRQSSIAIVLLLSLFGTVVSAQTTGTILPWVQGQFTDANGHPLASGSVFFYIAGSTTPLDTYSDSSLSTPNSNPIVLNAAGRNPSGGIYLSAALYKVVVKDSNGATITTQDNVSATVGFASVDNQIDDGRITCISATPVGDTNAISSNTMYLTPFKGNRIALYISSTWRIYTFSEVSLSVSGDAANTNYDLFAYANGSSVALERIVWSNATARTTGIVLQDGVYVKSGDATRRYLGTYRKDASGVLDDPNKRFVWNYYNRVRRRLQSTLETTDSWTYTTSAFRQANNSTANQVAVVVGVAEVDISLRLQGQASNTNVGASFILTIGEDGTTGGSINVLMGAVDSVVANARMTLQANLDRSIGIGYHFYPWLEYSSAVGTSTWYGDGGAPTLTQSGLIGNIEG